MKVFYHNDMDGKCAGYWVKKYAEERGEQIECIPMNYHLPFPLNKVGIDEEVWIVDFSVFPETMADLLAQTNNVIWIDHHKSAIERYENFNRGIEGLRVNGTAGCELTWIYIQLKKRGFNCYGSLDEMMALLAFDAPGDLSTIKIAGNRCPYFTRLIADRDIWKWQYGNDTAYFYLGLSADDTTPESTTWKFLDETPLYASMAVKHFIDRGQIISNYRDQWSREYREEWAFEVNFAGHKCLAMNIAKSGSEAFGKENIEKYDIVICFIKGGDGRWNFTFYSTKPDIDCAKIAMKYNGGGHKGAGGFSSSSLPWENRCNCQNCRTVTSIEQFYKEE